MNCRVPSEVPERVRFMHRPQTGAGFMNLKPIWVLVIVPLLLAGDKKLKWKEFQSPEKGFSALLPGEPEIEKKSVKKPQGEAFMTMFTVKVRQDFGYSVMVSEYPPGLLRPDLTDKILDGQRNEWIRTLEGKLLTEKKITLDDKFPGRALQLESERIGFSQMRVYLVKDRIYLLMVLGPKELATSKESADFLASFKLITAKDAKTAKKDIATETWTLDLAKMKLSENPASGLVQGSAFVPDKVVLQGNVLSFRTGKEFFADVELKVFLGLNSGKGVESQTYRITTDQRRCPHIHVSRKQEGGKLPKTGGYVGRYAMILEFGQIKNGQLPGKIYLCLPDESKSLLAGTFSAEVK
jgi:hypothetical protein